MCSKILCLKVLSLFDFKLDEVFSEVTRVNWHLTKESDIDLGVTISSTYVYRFFCSTELKFHPCI